MNSKYRETNKEIENTVALVWDLKRVNYLMSLLHPDLVLEVPG